MQKVIEAVLPKVEELGREYEQMREEKREAGMAARRVTSSKKTKRNFLNTENN